MTGAHFNPSLAKRGGGGDLAFGVADPLSTPTASGATWSGGLTPPPGPQPDPESVEERQSAQAKVQLISCHRERAPFNPRGAKPPEQAPLQLP